MSRSTIALRSGGIVAAVLMALVVPTSWSPPPAGGAVTPYVTVDPWCCGQRTSISALGWTDGTALTIQWDQGNNGSYEYTNSSQVAPAQLFLPEGSRAVTGDRVRVSGGGVTKDLVLETMRVEYVNAATDVVSGVAPAGRTVAVTANPGPGGTGLNATADGTGHWSVDFTGTFDIQQAVDGQPETDAMKAHAALTEAGGDGDQTTDQLTSYIPSIAVDPSCCWGATSVSAGPFSEGLSATVQWDQGNDGSYQFTQTVQSDGWISLFLPDGSLAVVGDRIRVSGGGWVKDLVIELVRVESVNGATDVVSGMAPPNRPLTIVANTGPEGVPLPTTADGTGRWTVDFTGVFDILPLLPGDPEASANIAEAQLVESGGDGDRTTDSRASYQPVVTVDASCCGYRTNVTSAPWAEGTSVTAQLDKGNDGSYEYAITSVAGPSGFVQWLFPEGTNAVVGDRVRASGGGWVKDLVVEAVRVDYVNAATDVVSGPAPAGRTVRAVIGYGANDAAITTTTSGAGRWSVDFTGTFDIQPAAWDDPITESQTARVEMVESGGDDVTFDAWYAYTPTVGVVPDIGGGQSLVQTDPWPEGVAVSVQLDKGNNGSYDYSTTSSSTEDGLRSVLLPAGTVAVPGDRVRVGITGGWVRDVVVSPVSIGSINTFTDGVTGTATPGATVKVYPECCSDLVRTTTASGTGTWSVDFTGLYDVTDLTTVRAAVAEPDGDRTIASRTAGPPAPDVTLAPATGLADGQVVAISGSGWPDARTVFVSECALGASPSATTCDPSTTSTYVTNAQGAFTGSFEVSRTITVDTPTPDTAYNCFTSPTGCGLVAAVWPGDTPFTGSPDAFSDSADNPIAFTQAPYPTAPGTPTVTGVTRSTASLSWTAPAASGFPVVSYTVSVYAGTSGTPASTVRTGSAATTRTITGLTPGTVYRFTVQAENERGLGSASAASARALPPFRTLDAFTDRQFRDFAGRAPTSTELTNWRNALTLGTAGADALVNAAVDFTYWAPKQAPVIRLFRAYFLRLPDIGGLNYWVGRYRTGTSLNTISNSFAGSAEFTTRYGSLTNRQFVELVYLNVLGRPGDSVGISYWTSQLDLLKKTRGQVMVGFSESGEYKTKSQATVDVVDVFTGMLRRVPTSSEYALWEPQLRSGTPRVALVASLLASLSYDARIPA